MLFIASVTMLSFISSFIPLLFLSLLPILTNGDTAQTLDKNNIMFGTCYDAPEENRFNDSCLHACQFEGECIDIIFSCYPFDKCKIECSGDESCHNLHLLSPSDRIDSISLSCTGEDACQNVVFQTFDVKLSFEQNLKLYMPQYSKFNNYYDNPINKKINQLIKQTFHNDTSIVAPAINGVNECGASGQQTSEKSGLCTVEEAEEQEDHSNSDNTTYLDEIEIKLVDFNKDSNKNDIFGGLFNDRFKINKDWSIVYGKHYMLLKNFLSIDTINEIQGIGKKFNETGEFQEHREFGDDEDTPYFGHTVIYLNNQLPQHIYNSYYSMLFGMFDMWQHEMVNMNDTDGNNNDELTGFVDIDIQKKYHLSHNWKYFRDQLNKYNARVIEYIDYAIDGSLGWHTDDDSELTMVSLLNNDNSFNGGTLQFKLHTLDRNIESISLQMGDVVLFPSLVDHRVLPVKSGSRQVLVIEWWDLPRNTFIGRHDAPAFWNLLKQKELSKILDDDMNWRPSELQTPFVFSKYNDVFINTVLTTSEDFIIENNNESNNQNDNDNDNENEDKNENDNEQANNDNMDDNIDSYDGYDSYESDIEMKSIMLDNDITFGQHFIHFHSILNNNIRNEITNMKNRCLSTPNGIDRDEKRKFGSDGNIRNIQDIDETSDENDPYANAGHTVTYMNDCFDSSDISSNINEDISEDSIDVYDYLKGVIIGGLDSLQYKCMINNSCEAPDFVNDAFDAIWLDGKITEFQNCYYIENEDNLPLMRHYGWKHDWYSMFQSCSNMESRVIEYIVYNTEGTLGWHTDDDSMITMVALISNETDFEGGELEFRSRPGDEVVEHVKLSEGDLIIFPSMADHRVLPISSGKRVVLVIEWWVRPRSYFDGRLTPEDFDKKLRKQERKRRQREKYSRSKRNRSQNRRNRNNNENGSESEENRNE